MSFIKYISLLLILITHLTVFNACKESESTSDVDTISIDTLRLSYLALGDSYTIGEGVAVDQRWPNQLVDRLTDSLVFVEDLKIIAKTGWRTDQLKEAIEMENPENYQMVSLLIGVNNQFQNRPFDVFQTEFVELLNTAISLSGADSLVFVVSIPDYGLTPFGQNNAATIASELDAYNSYMSEVCLQKQIPFVNITDISRELGDGDGALAPDNLHPSGLQYGKWVERILPVVSRLVREE